MDRVIKNFLYYGGNNPNELLFDCPELVGMYYMRILLYSNLEATSNMMTFNSPQLITNQSKEPNWIYNPYGLNIKYINFMILGMSQARNRDFDDLIAIMNMNGRLDYQHCYFNPAWGGYPLGFTYINKLLITAEFKKIPEKIYKPLPMVMEKKRILANIMSSPYTANVSSFSYRNNSLIGRFRVKLLNNYCISNFPENVGIYIISPQFSSSIVNGRYYLSEARGSRRINYGYSSDDVIGDFYGSVSFDVYQSRSETLETIQGGLFVFSFEEV